MSDFSSSSAFEKRTLVGLWWIPGNENKCYGTLYFDLDGEQKLYILGKLENDKDSDFSNLPRYDIIHGICREDNHIKHVTVLDATCINRSSNPFAHVESLSENYFSFHEIWIGSELYDSRDAIVFSSFCFGLNNLEIWHDTSDSFSVDIDDHFERISTKMTSPEPIKLFSDEKVTITVDYWKEAPGFRIGQTESTIRCIPQIHISSNNGSMPYYGDNESFEYYFFMIFHLFELFFWGQTFFFCIRGYLKELSSDSNQITVQEELLFARDITLKQRKQIMIPNNALLPYRCIKDSLPDLISNFQQYYNSMRVILDSVLSSISSTSYGMNSLPLLLFSVEGLQQIFYHSLGVGSSPENCADYTAFNSMKEQIIQLCNTDDQKTFVKKSIYWIKTFRDRLFAILIDQKDVFSFLDDDICSSLADDLKKVRNDAAHSDEREFNQLLSPLYYGQLIFVQYLHIAIIMKSCGLPAEVLKNSFDDLFNFRFQEMSAILRNHYGSTKAE